MKTRYTALVSIKKNDMQKAERVVQEAHNSVQNAQKNLEQALKDLLNITAPSSGKITQFLQNRTLIEAQRAVIQHNQEWLQFAQTQLFNAQEALKKTMIEYEKFKYLELQEIQMKQKEQKIKEAKDLDEVALMTFSKKDTLLEYSK